MQSKALIEGMVGPYLALGRRGLFNGTSRSVCLKEKTLKEGNSMTDVLLAGAASSKDQPSFPQVHRTFEKKITCPSYNR